ncbi:MAG: hypothetical protein HYX99_02605 [Chloroflexi bacterium]|nr:hypothetical protein [Chloroflexota bacterium]
MEEKEAVQQQGKLYCCEACAFQGSLKKGSICGSPSSVEAGLAYTRRQPPGKS